MYKVIIVDDEMLARVGIKSMIPWNEYGFELVGEYENGQIAFEAVKNLLPDIIITDIRMPVMNGIDLIREIRKENLPVKIIVLSSHDDFEYVKEAMKLGAEDYILKLEMEPEKLITILMKTAEGISSEKERKHRDISFDRKFMAELRLIKEKFFTGLVSGNITEPSEIDQGLKLLNIGPNTGNLVCIIVQLENLYIFENYTEEDIHILNNSITGILEGVTSNYGTSHVFNIKEALFAVIIDFENSCEETDLNNTIDRLIRNISDMLSNTLSLSISIGVSNIHKCFRDMPAAYLEAVQALNALSKSSRMASDIGKGQEEPPRKEQTIPLEEELIELEGMFRSFDTVGIERVLNRIEQKVEASHTMSKKLLNGICHTLIFIVNNFAQGYEISIDHLWGKNINPYRQIEELITLRQFTQWIAELRKNILAIMDIDNNSSTIILRAKQFIKRNYKENLSLEMVSEHLGLSPNYFSRVFSRGTGKSFIDYLIQTRIQISKELLMKTNLKIYEISLEVGYDNPHYFSRIFKKITGMTPFEYKSGTGVDRDENF